MSLLHPPTQCCIFSPLGLAETRVATTQLHANCSSSVYCIPPLHNTPHPCPKLAACHAGVWGYWSTDGLGLFEYMLLVEELDTEPVWVINNGVAHGDSELGGEGWGCSGRWEGAGWQGRGVGRPLLNACGKGALLSHLHSTHSTDFAICPYSYPRPYPTSPHPTPPHPTPPHLTPPRPAPPCPDCPPFAGINGADIMPRVQDALDSIEFITGPPDSTWGAVRAQMGHPEPWQLTYMAIGNEVGVGWGGVGVQAALGIEGRWGAAHAKLRTESSAP
jgi:alpha-L-arabinofuranosidase